MLYKSIRLIFKPIFKLLFKLNIHGIENIDNKNGIIICSNHLSNWDPITLAIVFDKPIHFIAKKELFEIPVLGNILPKLNVIPIDRDSVEISTMREGLNKINDGNNLGVFIEGTRVDNFDRKNAKLGVVMLARMSKSEILPVYIDTDYKLFKTIDVYIKPPMKIDLKKYNGSNKVKYKKQAEDILERIYIG